MSHHWLTDKLIARCNQLGGVDSASAAVPASVYAIGAFGSVLTTE